MRRLHGGPHHCTKYDYSACGFSPVHGEKIAVLEVYVDESGTHRSSGLPLTLVAGYVADVNRWAVFSAEWTRILNHYNVRYFHAKEFQNGNSRIFRHLGPLEKNDLLNSLVKNIRETVVAGVMCLVNPVEFKQLTTPKFRARHGTPYTWCVRGCVSLLYVLFPGPGEDSADIGIFLEDGHPNRNQAEELIRENKLHSDPIPLELRDRLQNGLLPHKPGYPPHDPFGDKGLKIRSYGHGSKSSMPPLQAADLLAYSMYAYVTSFGANRFADETSTAITKGIPFGLLDFTRDNIQPYIDELIEWESRESDNRRSAAHLIRELNTYGMFAKVNHIGLDIDISNATEEGIKKFFPELLR